MIVSYIVSIKCMMLKAPHIPSGNDLSVSLLFVCQGYGIVDHDYLIRKPTCFRLNTASTVLSNQDKNTTVCKKEKFHQLEDQ